MITVWLQLILSALIVWQSNDRGVDTLASILAVLAALELLFLSGIEEETYDDD